MALRRLFSVLDRFNGGDATGIRADGSYNPPQATPLIQRATILSVDVKGGALIALSGKALFASQVTDEPLRAGDDCWASETADGNVIIHGSVK